MFEASEYDPDAHLTIGELEFRFQPTVHYVSCWAMRVSNGVDGGLFYSADTGPSVILVPFAMGINVMVAEGAERRNSQEPFEFRGHLTPTEAGMLARQTAAKILVLSHLRVEDNPIPAVEEARNAFGGRVRLASPGLLLNWTS